MKVIQDYLRHAQECDDLAKTAATPAERDMIVNMAQTWRMLATQRGKLLLIKEKITEADRVRDKEP